MSAKEKVRCKEDVWNGFGFSQCARAASTPAGYCKTHDPTIRAAKQEAQVAKWDAEAADRNARWNREALAKRIGEAVLMLPESVLATLPPEVLAAMTEGDQ